VYKSKIEKLTPEKESQKKGETKNSMEKNLKKKKPQLIKNSSSKPQKTKELPPLLWLLYHNNSFLDGRK